MFTNITKSPLSTACDVTLENRNDASKKIIICVLDLRVGDIVKFEGARFEIVSTEIFSENCRPEPEHGIDAVMPVMQANAKWLSGSIMRGYFGPDYKDWCFQGNKFRSVVIES